MKWKRDYKLEQHKARAAAAARLDYSNSVQPPLPPASLYHHDHRATPGPPVIYHSHHLNHHHHHHQHLQMRHF